MVGGCLDDFVGGRWGRTHAGGVGRTGHWAGNKIRCVCADELPLLVEAVRKTRTSAMQSCYRLQSFVAVVFFVPVFCASLCGDHTECPAANIDRECTRPHQSLRRTPGVDVVSLSSHA